MYWKENTEIQKGYDNDWNPNESNWKYDCIRVRLHTIPDTFQTFPIKGMAPNSGKIKKHEQKPNGI